MPTRHKAGCRFRLGLNSGIAMGVVREETGGWTDDVVGVLAYARERAHWEAVCRVDTKIK